MVTTLESFSSHDAARLSGATYRQVEYWDRLGYVQASVVAANGSGSARRFSRQDVLDLRVIRMFVDARVSPMRGALAAAAARGRSGWVMLGERMAVNAQKPEQIGSFIAAEHGPVLVLRIPTWESLQ